MGYIVKQNDLIGDIRNLPIEVVQQMVKEAEAQGNKNSITAFQQCKNADRYAGGFDWWGKPPISSFWNKVINHSDWDLFFTKYHKHTFPKIMEVDFSPEFKFPNKRVVLMKKNGKFLAWSDAETFAQAEEEMNLTEWEYARDIIVEEPTIELTLEDIAKKFEVSVDKIKIKK